MNPYRRRLFKTSAIATAAGMTTLIAPGTAKAAISASPYVTTVGTGGDYATILDAANYLATLPLSAAQYGVIRLLPGTHPINSAEVSLPNYCAVVGDGPRACLIRGRKRIRYNKNTVFAGFRYEKITTDGSSAGCIADSEAINGSSSGFLWLHNVELDTRETSNLSSVQYTLMLNDIRYVKITDSIIYSGCSGINCSNTISVNISGTEIYLLNIDVNQDHIGIRKADGGRIWINGCKIATGYGPEGYPPNGGILNESDQNIIGVLVASKSGGGRVELFNTWCIVRNESGASAGVMTQCVRNESNYANVRIYNGYYQAEDGGDDNGERIDLVNLALVSAQAGKFQLYGGVDFGTSYGRIGGSTINQPGQLIDSDITLISGMGETLLCDSSAGSLMIKLPFLPAIGDTHTIIRINDITNRVVIHAGGRTINGQASIDLPNELYAKVTIRYLGDVGQWIIS